MPWSLLLLILLLVVVVVIVVVVVVVVFRNELITEDTTHRYTSLLLSIKRKENQAQGLTGLI